VSLVLMTPSPSSEAPAALRPLARAGEAGLARISGPFDALATKFAAAAAQSSGEFVLAVTADMRLPDGFAAKVFGLLNEYPDADAFALRAGGLTPDRLWRGSRCRSHERNLESLRFARLIPAGALLVRRSALLAACETLTPDLGADWWATLAQAIAARGRVVEIEPRVRRAGRLPGEPPCPSFAAPRPRNVLVLGQIEASASLYFDFLETCETLSVGFRPLTRLAVDAPHLAASGLVILVRELHRFWDEGVIDFLDAAGIPYVYFTDDNFLALGAESAASGFYAPVRMRRALAGALQVWASTPALASALEGLHPDVRVWGPVVDPLLSAQTRPPHGDGLTIAFAGGDFRLAGFDGPILESLRRLARIRAVRFVGTDASVRAFRPQIPDAQFITVPQERSFRQFVRRWRSYAPDILLHPRGETANAPFKCPTAVIVAGYLGAVPVVADEPAYAGWTAADGVIRLGAEACELDEAGARARDDEWRADMGCRLASAIARSFGESGRLGQLEAVLTRGEAGPRAHAAGILSSAAFRGRRAGLGVAHATRWVRDLVRSQG
jgi:hypothetical protein